MATTGHLDERAHSLHILNMNAFNCISYISRRRYKARESPIKMLKWIMGKRCIQSRPIDESQCD